MSNITQVGLKSQQEVDDRLERFRAAYRWVQLRTDGSDDSLFAKQILRHVLSVAESGGRQVFKV